jgi:primosomal protein N' (replication factor Y)
MEGSFSRKLIEHIRKTLSEGGQIMVLRSRRAWASAMQCEECGEIQKCPHCNVSLSLHKTGDTGFLSCHYCGHREAYRTTCIKCNGAIRPLGSGTQKIEEEAAVLFPQARIARLDSDTAQNRNYETKVIKEFAEGNIDILIGTQILTKGFDFSNLRLTAVIAADTMLGIQDFRADEKALQLLEQFKGRCGRRGSKGTFIIQTSQPEHPIYQRIVNGETKKFSDSLLAERKMFGFPPYSRIVEITIRDGNQKRADLMASRLTATLRQVFKSPSGQGLLAASPVTGPYSPVVDRVLEEHIRCIRISMRKDRTLASNKAVLNETVLTFEKDQKYNGHITLNVDPA